jgi:hypothetical protein
MMTAVMVMTTVGVSTAIVITEVDEMTAISGVTAATIAMTIVATTGVDMERTIYLHLQPRAIQWCFSACQLRGQHHHWWAEGHEKQP